MPKRFTQRNQPPEDGAADQSQAPRKKKRRLIPRWVGFVGLSIGSAVVGGLAWRKFEEAFPRKKPEPEPQPQPQLGGGMPVGTFPMPMPVPVPMQMFPPAPARAPSADREMGISELKALLKRKQAEEKARRTRLVEDEFWDQ